MAFSSNISWEKWVQRLQSGIAYPSQLSSVKSEGSWGSDLKTGLWPIIRPSLNETKIVDSSLHMGYFYLLFKTPETIPLVFFHIFDEKTIRWGECENSSKNRKCPLNSHWKLVLQSAFTILF